VSSTNFQSMEIPSWGSVCAHASIVRREARVRVTVLCETQ
jgi:hypothetical protein